MSPDDVFARYGTEARCAAALEAARWPQGFVCPHCGATAHGRFHADRREDRQCAHCRVQTSLTCGTLLERPKLPPTKWFQAMYPVTQNKNHLSALSLKRHLGVCCRTAWRLEHKLLEAMAERESGRVLTDVVVADVAVVGGKHGRGAESNAALIAAVELNDDGHPRHVRFDVLPDLKGDPQRASVRTALDRLNRRFDLPPWSGDSGMPAFAPRPAPRHGCAWQPSARREITGLRHDANCPTLNTLIIVALPGGKRQTQDAT